MWVCEYVPCTIVSPPIHAYQRVFTSVSTTLTITGSLIIA